MSAKAKTTKKSQNHSAPKTEEQIDNEFAEEYKKLCEKYNRLLIASPSLRHNPNSNDFSIVVNWAVGRNEPE